jgi:hypothetical protein
MKFYYQVKNNQMYIYNLIIYVKGMPNEPVIGPFTKVYS